MRRTSRWLMPLLSLALFFGAIGVAQAAGWWVTSGRQAVAVGEMTIGDLKGWMTVQQAADGLGVPADDLVGLVGAPTGVGVTAATAFKDIEGLVPGFDLTAYREAVQGYLAQRSGPVPAVRTASVPTATASNRPTGTPPADLDPDTVLRDIQGVVPGFEIQAIRDAVAAVNA